MPPGTPVLTSSHMLPRKKLRINLCTCSFARFLLLTATSVDHFYGDSSQNNKQQCQHYAGACFKCFLVFTVARACARTCSLTLILYRTARFNNFCNTEPFSSHKQKVSFDTHSVCPFLDILPIVLRSTWILALKRRELPHVFRNNPDILAKRIFCFVIYFVTLFTLVMYTVTIHERAVYMIVCKDGSVRLRDDS